METIEQLNERFDINREQQFKQAKEDITFRLNGRDKYSYAFQCAAFKENVMRLGFDHVATADAVKEQGLFFNEHCITLGHYYGHDLKRFKSKDEMFGFVIGFNEFCHRL